MAQKKQAQTRTHLKCRLLSPLPYGPAQGFSPSGDGDGEALPGILIV
jgi:hypothetical protein